MNVVKHLYVTRGVGSYRIAYAESTVMNAHVVLVIMPLRSWLQSLLRIKMNINRDRDTG